ncbi:MAG: mechanosensitive ion channel family protein [Balneolia bacterium]|nr:mechanosensitive ion channel family protein [Balneolia bacterium]
MFLSIFAHFSERINEMLASVETEAYVGLLILFSISTIIHIIIRVWIIRLLQRLDEKTETEWYAAILRHKLPQRALMLIPLMVLYIGIDLVPSLSDAFSGFITRLTAALMILVAARVIDALLSSAHTLYLMLPKSHMRPIKSYIQLGKVIVYLFSIIFIIASLSDQSPWYFLSGIGAITAILLLVFRDTLLSLVASVQLTNNDLIRIGDWIEMPNFGADGDVIDISLNTVRVQNFDKTITVIPTHKFLEHSFRNWRGMSEAGGRRIMRSLNIDISTIRFLTMKEINRLRKTHLLGDYIDSKMKEVGEYNEKFLKENPSILTNSRWLTNVGTFRAYVIEYLKNHPRAKKDLLILVRQLEPTDRGLPLQVYVFTNTTAWAEYEGIQADIFDHLLAVMPEFDLKVYQQPAGTDFRLLSTLKS